MTKNQRPILFIVILLFLRIPLLFLGSFGVISKDLSLVIYLLFTYLFTALFIGKYVDNLEQYYITPTSLIIFLAAPILGILTMPFDPIVYLRGIISLILGGYLIKREYFKFEKFNKLEYRLSNLLVFIAFIFAFILLNKYVLGKNLDLFKINSYEFLDTFAFQLSFAPVSEEPLFRGIMMGEMIKRKTPPAVAIAIQGGIFWFAHIYYANTGLNFWVLHPIISIMLGILVYKGKSITNSMLFHGLVNTLGSLFLRN